MADVNLTCAIFQSTLPRRERLWGKFEIVYYPVFQSTLPRRERRKNEILKLCFRLFQSTLPRRERLWGKFEIVYYPVFQSTLPRRERQLPARSRLMGFPHFNPRSREGSDADVLTKNVTKWLFQSTLPRRERRSRKSAFADQREFQSTLPRRERPF